MRANGRYPPKTPDPGGRVMEGHDLGVGVLILCLLLYDIMTYPSSVISTGKVSRNITTRTTGPAFRRALHGFCATYQRPFSLDTLQ